MRCRVASCTEPFAILLGRGTKTYQLLISSLSLLARSLYSFLYKKA